MFERSMVEYELIVKISSDEPVCCGFTNSNILVRTLFDSSL